MFNYDAATDHFSADAPSLSDCGFACHTVVKAKDYIFHPYEKRWNRACPRLHVAGAKDGSLLLLSSAIPRKLF